MSGGGSEPKTRRQILKRQAKERKISSIAQAAMTANTGLTLLRRPKSRKKSNG